METEAIALLRGDIAGLRHDVAALRQDVGILETKADSLEAWRIRYLTQEDQIINKLFGKIDELVAGLGNVRTDLSRTRGERDAERRISVMVISLLSAACGGLVTSLFHG
jgi:hypothetical protein